MNSAKNIIENIKRKYKTNSPYEIANLAGIQIHRSKLGQIRGYYHKAYRIKQIFLNCELEKHEEEFVLSHELGHAFMHSDANTPFLRTNTYLSVDRMEMEANQFAMYLLIPDDDLLEYQSYSLEQLSWIFGYHEELIRLRLD